MPYNLRSREAVDCMLAYDTAMRTVEYGMGFPMIGWLHGSGISGWWKYSVHLAAFSSWLKRTPRCDLARNNMIYW